MVELAKAHESAYQEYQAQKQANTATALNFHNPLIQINDLFKSFQKRNPVASMGGATTMVNAQHGDRHAINVTDV